AHEDFAEQAEKEKALGERMLVRWPDMGFDRPEETAVLVLLHDAPKDCPVEPFDGGKPLGDELAMAAMTSEDVILRAKRERGTDGGSLLADGEMRGSAI